MGIRAISLGSAIAWVGALFMGLAWARWRYVDADYPGLDASDSSRPEMGVEIKAAWRTLIYRCGP